MKFLLGGFLLFVLAAVALGIFKFLLVKLFVLSVWIGAIALIVYGASRLLKKA